MAKAGAAKKAGGGGVVISEAKRIAREMIEKVTKDKEVKKIPTLKFDRIKGSDRADRVGDPALGEYNREATGLTLGRQEELDDMNMLNEIKRNERVKQAPTEIRGEPSNLNRELKEQGYKGYRRGGAAKRKRGGGVEIGKIEGDKGKRRMDKKAR